jgi:pimeloyl-ACP methyl ester carboxylesterase
MSRLANGLEDAGFIPVNLNYASRENTIQALALETVPRGLSRCELLGAQTVHFVTHSMGGILVRYFLDRQRPVNLGRVVMLSPPNRGSEAADHLQDSTLYRWYNGPAGQQLVTGQEGLPEQLGPVDFPLGVITGNQHSFFDYWLADLIPGVNDGKVSVERAKVEGMTDFLVLPYSHPFIMNAREVIEQTSTFLHQGRFRHLSPEAARSTE